MPAHPARVHAMKSRFKSIVFTLGGLSFGLALALSSLFLTGAGHGRGTGLFLFLVLAPYPFGLLLYPLAGYSLAALPRTSARKVLMGTLGAHYACLLFALFVHGPREFEEVAWVWGRMAEIVVTTIVLYVAGHTYALRSLLRAGERQLP